MKYQKVKIIYKLIPTGFKKLQVFWDVLGFLATYYPNSRFREIPNEIIIEPGNPCNLRCPVCPTHFAMNRLKGFMSLELFKSIIDELKPLKKKPQISMNFAGEPLLNQNIIDFVEYASKNKHPTFISTNVTMMTEKIAEGLINSGLSSIHLCMDGFSKKSHEGYRVGSDFNVVKRNIELFMETKIKLKSQTPFVSIQTLLTSFSESEMDEIIAWARKIGADEVNFKSLSMGSYTTKEMKKKYAYLLPKNLKLRRKSTNVYKTVCPTPLEQALIYWNGDLGLCCVDFDNILNIGNIKEKGFIKTFRSKEVIRRRKMGFLKQYKLCKSCSLGNADSMGFDFPLK